MLLVSAASPRRMRKKSIVQEEKQLYWITLNYSLLLCPRGINWPFWHTFTHSFHRNNVFKIKETELQKMWPYISLTSHCAQSKSPVFPELLLCFFYKRMLIVNANCLSGNFCSSELWNALLAQCYPVLINTFTETSDFTLAALVNIFTVESCNYIHPHIQIFDTVPTILNIKNTF